ncbi:hypothetical protein ERJ75_001612200 [Trypanosoma vivax]|nr:hypothetical protein ERJ75_001612200 [Trypanosoma vivax]
MLRGSNDACADNQQQQVPVKVEHSVSDAAVAVPTQPKEGSTKAESVPASQAAAANVNSTHSMEAERSTAEQVINSDAVEQQRTQSLPLESRSNPKTPKNDTRSRKSPEAGVVSSREPSAVPSLQRSMVGDKLQSGVRGKGTEATRGGESPSPQPTGAPSVDRQSSVVDDRAASSPSLNLPPKTGEDKCPENIKVDQGDAVAPDELGKVRDEHEESEHESRHAPDDCARIAEAEDSAAVEEGMEGNAEVVEVEDAGAAPKLAMPASALKRKIRVVDIPSHNLKSGASPRQNNGDAADGGKKKGRVVSRSGSNRRQRGQGHTGAQNRSKSTSGPKPLTHERGREKTSGAAVATGRQRSTSRKYFSRDPRDRPWLSNFDRNGCVSWNRSKGLSPERRSVSAGKYRTSVGIPPFSELTMSNVRRHAQQFPGARHPFANHGQSFSEESSQFRSCVSQDAMSLENACDILQMRLSKRLRYDGAREQRASMPSHQRQAKNMAEGGVRGRKTVDADVDNYVSKMRAGLKTDGRGRGPQPWPGRAGRPGTSGHPATARHSLSGPPGRRVIQPSRLEEELKLTFRPNISKYAHALPRNQVPCHQRLYTPRDVTPRRRTVGITDDQMPPPSSRVRELMDSMNCVLFQPNISRRAKAIENEKKFSDRLYPAKELERLRRDKARSQSPGCSPRRSPAISPHPSLRHTREVERAERSFRPAISPRARRMEYGEPFYERLYPCKESRMDEHDREANTPCNSPRQAAREGRAVSPRHSARPGRPSERAVPSFRPDISPRSEASRRSLFPYDWMHPSKAVTRGDAKGQASGHQFDIEFPRQRGGGGQGRSSHNEKERVKKSAIRAQNAPEEPTRTSRICANS